jgi:protein gp37
MGRTTIEWSEFSTNPIRARHKTTGAVGHYCELASPGCAHCYSSTLQKRFKMPPFGKQHRGDIEPFLDESKLRDVLRRQKPTKFFWCDMTDLFGDWVPDEWIDKCFATMALSGRHTHQVLTKRAARMQEYVRGLGCKQGYERLESAARSLGWSLRFHDLPLVRWPIPNIWLGVSVEDRKRTERISHLRDTPAVVRFLSIEPLLEKLGPLDLTEIDLVIVGGESGHGARPCNVDWIRSIIDQCKAAGTACFVKQLGAVAIEREPTVEEVRQQRSFEWEWPEGTSFGNRTGNVAFNGRQVLLKDKKGGDPAEWPSDLRVREMPQT